LKKIPFKPRKLDDEIRERATAIRLENCSVGMSNIFVSDADIGISVDSKTRLLLRDYHAIRTRKPFEVRD